MKKEFTDRDEPRKDFWKRFYTMKNNDGRFKDFQDFVAFAYFEGVFGDLKNAQGFYKEAYNYHNSAYEKFSRLLGDESPKTSDAMNNLALTFCELKRYEEALELQEEILSFYKEHLGDEHPDTISAMNNLALTLNNSGRKDEAKDLIQQAKNLIEKN